MAGPRPEQQKSPYSISAIVQLPSSYKIPLSAQCRFDLFGHVLVSNLDTLRCYVGISLGGLVIGMTQLALHHIQISPGGNTQCGKRMPKGMNADILQCSFLQHRMEQPSRISNVLTLINARKDVRIPLLPKFFEVVQDSLRH